ncbi:MAG: hypothetical protein WCI18_12765 [Pseudomonadota bacterium]
MEVKRKLYLAFVIFSVLSSAAFAGPTVVTAPVTSLYIPTGFDDNDNSEIVVAGVFPSACYKAGSSQVQLNPQINEIEVSVTAYKYDGFCAQVLTPFLQTIKLGILKAGDYTVRIRRSELMDHISIGKSLTRSPDDYLYAPVENAAMDLSDGSQKIILEGTFPYTFVGCAVMSEIKLVHKKKDILEVLPIMELINDDRCHRENNEFRIGQNLPEKLQGKVLLHVRVLNGQSYSRLVNLD